MENKDMVKLKDLIQDRLLYTEIGDTSKINEVNIQINNIKNKYEMKFGIYKNNDKKEIVEIESKDVYLKINPKAIKITEFNCLEESVKYILSDKKVQINI